MSEGTVAFPSNTICYFDKPPAPKVESDKLNSNQQSTQGIANPDAAGSAGHASSALLKPVGSAGAAARLDERGNVATPGPTINAVGQVVGTLVNEVA